VTAAVHKITSDHFCMTAVQKIVNLLENKDKTVLV